MMDRLFVSRHAGEGLGYAGGFHIACSEWSACRRCRLIASAAAPVNPEHSRNKLDGSGTRPGVSPIKKAEKTKFSGGEPDTRTLSLVSTPTPNGSNTSSPSN